MQTAFIEPHTAALITLAAGLVVNTGALLTLVFRMGRYIGNIDTKMDSMESNINVLAQSDQEMLSIMHKQGETLASVVTDLNNVKMDVRGVRDRQHDFANQLIGLTGELVRQRVKEDKDV